MPRTPAFMVVPHLHNRHELEKQLVELISVIDNIRSTVPEKDFLIDLRRASMRTLLNILITNSFAKYFVLNTDVITSHENPFDFI